MKTVPIDGGVNLWEGFLTIATGYSRILETL